MTSAVAAPRRKRAAMRGELAGLAAPVLDRLKNHPFWAGLCAGTLPPATLWYFAEQDARYVVPTYARGLAHCAALAERDAHGGLLSSASQATFGSLTRLFNELATLAGALGKSLRPLTAPAPPITAYTSFMLAAPATSFVAGVGGLLPMTWFHLLVSDELRQRCVPRSRYAAWVEQYLPHAGYRDYVTAYLGMVDDVATRCSAGERDQLAEWFALGARHELAFADAAWGRQAWPV